VTYCFCSQEEQWFEFDDDKVKSQTVPEIQEAVKNAYILFLEP